MHQTHRLITFLGVPVAVAVLGLIATVPLDWKTQLVSGIVLFGLGAVLSSLSNHRRVTLLLIFTSLFCSSRYIYWRLAQTEAHLRTNWSETAAVDLGFAIILLLAELYAFVVLILGFFQTARPLQRNPIPLPTDPSLWPTVDIFIPTYNEPLTVVRTTVLAALNIDWPAERMKVFILDDGKREEFADFATECGCEYTTRSDNKHAKAGNINSALTKTSGEYIAIFDCDHVPTRSFLQVAMGWLCNDNRMAMVQTPHLFYSPDPFERNLKTFRTVPNEGSLFYGVVQEGSDLWNAAFFCGSCAVIRRTALEEVGGIAVETVTEDAHTSLRMQKNGWSTAYIRFAQAGGLATGSLAAHIGQRIRWARGMVQILRIENPIFARGMKMTQRLCYFNSALHYLYGIPRLIFLTAPLVYLLLGRSTIFGFAPTILAYALPHLLFATLTNSRVQGKHRHSFWNEVYETVLAPYIVLPTSVALLSPKHGKFNVTSKEGMMNVTYLDWNIAQPYLILLALNSAGLLAGIYRLMNGSATRSTLLMNLFWTVYNTVMISAAIAVAVESRQRRAAARVPVKLSAEIILAGGQRILARAIDLSPGGGSFAAPDSAEISTGSPVQVNFHMQEGVEGFPARVVYASKGRVRVEFPELDIDSEARLIKVVFGRANTWLHWGDGLPRDRPLKSLATIVRIAGHGLIAAPRAILAMRRRTAVTLSPIPARSIDSKPAVVGSLALLLAFAVAATGLIRAAVLPDVHSNPSAGEFTDTLSLSSLNLKKAVELVGTGSHATVNFGVPISKIVTRATLKVQYRYSGSLEAGSGEIHVALNGLRFLTIPLGHGRSAAEVLNQQQVELPADLLGAENDLVFDFTGSCGGDCKGSPDPVLWTRIDGSTQIQISGVALPLANDFRLLPAPFFDKSGKHELRLSVAFSDPPDNTTLEAAGIVSSWLGVLANQRGVRTSVTIGTIPVGNLILIGRKNMRLLAPFELTNMPGPVIAIRDNPVDPYGKIIVVTGDNPAEIVTAARAVALGELSETGDTVVVKELALPARRVPYDAPRWLSTDHTTSLGQGLAPEQLQIDGPGSVDLFFRLPPDLHFGERATIPLRLQYTVSGLSSSEKSDIRFRLNGKFVASRTVAIASHSKEKSAADVREMLIALPTASLSLNNTLTLEFAPDARHIADAKNASDYPKFRVLASTNVDLRGVPHYVEMARLDLFANSGFPYTLRADLSDTAVVIPSPAAPGIIASYLDMTAFFAAETGYPGLRVTVVDPIEALKVADKDLLVLDGDEENVLLTSWADNQPLSRSGGRWIGRPRSLWHRTVTSLRTAFGGQNDENMDGLLERDRLEGLLEGFASPLNGSHSVIVFWAGSPEQVNQLESGIHQPVNLAALYGDISLVRNGQFRSFFSDFAPYSLGSLPWIEAWNLWAARFAWAAALPILLCALFLSWYADGRLESRASRRLHINPVAVQADSTGLSVSTPGS